ncbi:MAG: hypothetical protein ACLQIJ_18220 [Polyangia bacterium]
MFKGRAIDSVAIISRDVLRRGEGRLFLPADIVRNGGLPVVEALPWLVDACTTCMGAVSSARKPSPMRSLGEELCTHIVQEVVAGFYGVDPNAIQNAVSYMKGRVTFDKELQPWIGKNIDAAVLRRECDALLNQRGWGEVDVLFEAFASCPDPRLELVRSRVAINATGIAWANFYRPQQFQTVPFARIRLIDSSSRRFGGRRIVFDEWKQREFWDEGSEQWRTALGVLEKLSSEAGLVWKYNEARRP